VSDEVGFAEPKSFESALVTWGKWKQISESELLVSDDGGAVRVKIETGGQPFAISAETLNEDVHSATKPVRLGIALQSPVKEAVVVLTLTPAQTRR
jgi:hypothetical protein